jgi:hypothetical protein
MKKPIEKQAEKGTQPAKPWMKKQPSEEKAPEPPKPWVKKAPGKPSDEEPPKPWMKKPPAKSSAEEDKPQKPWMKKPLPKPSEEEDKPPRLPPPLKPGNKGQPPEPTVDSEPEPIEEEPPLPPRPPPSSAFPKVPNGDVGSPGMGKKVPPPPGNVSEEPALKKAFTYRYV